MASTVLLGAPPITFAPGRKNLSSLHARIALYIPVMRCDLQFGGLFRISGTTAVAANPDVPVSRRVSLLDQATMRQVRVTMSAEGSGAYEFSRIRMGPWIVISRDHTSEYNAVIADNIIGEQM